MHRRWNGFDPAFYCFRPDNVFAVHGYGPVLLDGAEIVKLAKNNSLDINYRLLLLKKSFRRQTMFKFFMKIPPFVFQSTLDSFHSLQ
jgi:hypothetical protein